MTAEPTCPECTQGKHGNCTGWALNESTDDFTNCRCLSREQRVMNGADHFREAERLAEAYKQAHADVEKMPVDTKTQSDRRFFAASAARGRGRPRRYCSEEHRREADTMRKRTVARLALLRDQVRRDEHLLAALGGDESGGDDA